MFLKIIKNKENIILFLLGTTILISIDAIFQFFKFNLLGWPIDQREE